MDLCPSRNQLRQLLAEELNPAELKIIEAHIEACETCQDVLPTLVADPEMDRWRALLNADAKEENEQRRNLLQRLDLLTRLPCKQGTDGESVSDAEPIRFPGQSTERGPLGRLEPFEIQKELGRGAMGSVFQAYDERLNRIVAIKVLKPELAVLDSYRKRFDREARAIAGIKHEHVVAIHELGDRPDFLPYLVMEYVEGESLSDLLKREKSLPPREAASLTREAALGLAAAHTQGVLHRDIKPSNLLLERTSGRVKIADFGLARILQSFGDAASQPGHLLGTPAYMSPEQLASPDNVDARTDVYSLGVVLYELLTGQRLHCSDGHALLMEVVHAAPQPPRQVNPDVPANLETICLKAMAKRPDDRYQSATELANDLQRYLDGQPVAARPVTQHHLIRNRRKFIATALGLLLISGVFVAYSIVTSSSWELLPPLGIPLDHAMTVAADDRFFILGGLDGNDAPIAQVREYGLLQGSWWARAAFPKPRHSAAVGLFEKQILVAGGWVKTVPATDPGTTDTLLIYDLERDQWSNGPNMPIKSGSSIGGVIGKKFYVVTGNNGDNAVNEFHAFDIDKRTWIKLSPPPHPHELGAGVVLAGKLYVVGGNDSLGGKGNTRDLDMYDPENEPGKAWTTMAPMPTARWSLGAAVSQGKIYAVGGARGQTPLSTVEVYDPITNSWESSPALQLQMPRYHLSVVGVRDNLYALGGHDGKTRVTTMEVLKFPHSVER